jgi:hypothetical protein
VSQIWTAPITVQGAVEKHGGGPLASLDDVSHKVNLELDDLSFEAGTGVVTLVARLKNASTDTLSAPLMARVIELRSDLGIPELLDTGASGPGVGAVLDFTPLLQNNRLEPKATTGAMPLRVRLSDLRLVRKADAPTGILSLKARILGPALSDSGGGGG